MSFLCHSARMSSPAPFESVGGDPLQFEMVHQNHCFGDSRSDAFHVGGLRTCSLPIVFFLGFLIALTCPSAVFAADIFRTHVAPILERRCLSCHNHQDRRGDFSLQTANDLADSGFVVSGRPDESHLLSVLVAESDRKPPTMPKDADPLSDEEVRILRDWIISGAEWPAGIVLTEPVIDDFNWWSLRPLMTTHPPEFQDQEAQAWIRTPVDAFILQKLREHQLRPSPQADRRTLIRRVTYDLTGLPPTPEEIEAFIGDESPDAWTRLVERLLASPHYGERWARHWLDVVRYADTCGYDKDKLRPSAWPYRDYVIRAFNDDKPYSRFVQEQLAGDVLFPGTGDGILALGFIAAGPWDFIGHVEVPESKTDGKVARNLDRDDMVSGTLNSFCSVTIQCARCHNHKFDPFTQEHYYSLQSVFAAVDRAERVYDLDPKTEEDRRELTRQIEKCRSDLRQLNDSIQEEGGSQLRELETLIGKHRTAAEPSEKRPEYGFHSAVSGTPDSLKWVEVDLGSELAVSRVILHPCHDEFGGIGAGFGFPVRFQIFAISESVRRSNPADAGVLLLDAAETEFPNPGLNAVETRVSGMTARYIRVVASQLAPRQNDFILALAELEVFDDTGRNRSHGAIVNAADSIEAPVRWRKSNLTDGIWPQPADPESAAQLAGLLRDHEDLIRRLNTPERVSRRTNLMSSLAKYEQELQSLPPGRLVYAAATHFTPQGNFRPTNGKPRPVHILHRGNETQPGNPVVPGAIPLAREGLWKFDLAENHGEAERRAALAQWVTRPDHPLTWRSIVNRIWQYHIGRGIVDSPNDFGRMGQLPSHPELLDWMAAEFLRRGESFKAMHRLIVHSAAYQQASRHDPAAAAVDSENQLLWRMNRRRLEAEEIRDSILAVSGRLNREMGGPGYYLFELEKPEHSPHFVYHKFDPDDHRSHRRSIYRFIVRSQPDPFMTTLDCADSSQSTPRRHETLTALQALSLLNNPFTTTMARHFAESLQRDAASVDEQITRGFRMVTGRSPETHEHAAMSVYARDHGMPALCRIWLNLTEFLFVD